MITYYINSEKFVLIDPVSLTFNIEFVQKFFDNRIINLN